MAPSLAEIDLTDLDLFATRMPHDWFDLLRRRAPVWRHPETANEEAFWVVSTYDRITEVHRRARYRHRPGPARRQRGDLDQRCPCRDGCRFADGDDRPAETPSCASCEPSFTPRMVSRLTQTMRCDRIIPGPCRARARGLRRRFAVSCAEAIADSSLSRWKTGQALT